MIEALAGVLARPDQHYESILGFLETQLRRPGAGGQRFHGIYGWLAEMVYWILYFRHVNNIPRIHRTLPSLKGIVQLADTARPLWVFSLNHDLLIECFGRGLRCPYKLRLHLRVVTFPRRDAAGHKIGDLRGEVITGAHLETSAMPFWQPGTRGINLLKVHGSLDTFTFKDGKEFLRFLPHASGSAGVIDTLRAVNQELLYIHPADPKHPVKATNEIAYADEGGEMQFLRRSLLAGAFKFDSRMSQVLPSVIATTLPLRHKLRRQADLHRVRVRRHPHQPGLARLARVQRNSSPRDSFSGTATRSGAAPPPRAPSDSVGLNGHRPSGSRRRRYAHEERGSRTTLCCLGSPRGRRPRSRLEDVPDIP